MQDLINQVSSKIGVDPDQARVAVETVVNYIKGKLPAPIAAQVEKVVSGGGGDGGGDLGDQLKGMFGS